MKLSSVSACALFACSTAIGACSQSTALSRFQYTPDINAVRERGASPLSYSVLYSFGAAPDGNNPDGALIDVGGTLYGTTAHGGKYCGSYGCGTVFSITTGGTEKVLYSFGNGTDGTFPDAALIDVSGTLYGTTQGGGAYNDGTVFSISTAGAEKVVYSFSPLPDGRSPAAPLINVGGTLYGTTTSGGKYCAGSGGCGTVFSVTTGGTEKVLHSFGNGTDGFLPLAPLTNVKGTFYGTTSQGGANVCNFSPPECGTVFSITTGGTEKTLHSFGKGTDGEDPSAGLIDVGGTLYGTTRRGGTYYCAGPPFGPPGCGTVFSITTGGTEKVLHSFNGSDGFFPIPRLIDVSGTLYGTTSGGGKYCAGSGGCGTVFSVTTGGTEKVLHSFGNGTDGSESDAPLISVKGMLYGTTVVGGTHGYGTVFALTP